MRALYQALRWRTRRWHKVLALSWFGLGLFLLFYPLFSLFALREADDFAAHIRFSLEMAETGTLHSERPAFEILTFIASGFSPTLEGLAFGAAAVATLAMVAKVLISAQLIGREVRLPWSLALALLLLFLAPITLRWADHPLASGHSPVHLGQMSGFNLHNPTTVLVFPFALLLFWYSWRERYVPTAFLAAIQCLIKPNFVAAWVPAYLVLQLWRHRLDWNQLARTAASLLPVTAVLWVQYLASDTLGTGMIIAPLKAWNEFSDNILLSSIRSLAFPVLFTAVYFREVRHRADHAFAWAIFVVAFTQYAFLYITGDVYSGNWSWGRYLSIYIVFLLCLVRFAAICSQPQGWRSGLRVVTNLVLGGLVVLHLHSGVRYYLEAVTRARW